MKCGRRCLESKQSYRIKLRLFVCSKSLFLRAEILFLKRYFRRSMKRASVLGYARTFRGLVFDSSVISEVGLRFDHLHPNIKKLIATP